MSGTVEAERKYTLGPNQDVPDLSAVAAPGPVAEFDLEATYYDSPDFRLAAARQVIRRRTGGTDAGWHLKRPGGRAEERTEFHADLAHPRPPQEFRDLVADALEGAPLVPVAVLRTHRREQELRGPDGTVLALVCTDDVEALSGDHRQSWREAEVELVNGDTAFADAVGEVLERAGVHRSDSPSKAARAMGPAIEAAGAARESAGAALMAYCAQQVGVLQAHETGVRSDGDDAVHRSRVSTRRLRSALRTYGGLFPPGAVTHVRAELRWHAEQLGAARDTEVLLERLVAALGELPHVGNAVAGRLTSALSDAHAIAHAHLVESMATQRYEELQHELERLLVSPGLEWIAAHPASEVLPPMLANAVARVAKLAAKAAARPGDLVRWHEVRKAAKAGRYGAEVLVELLGEAADAYRALWEQVTEAFGEVQDCVLARETLERLAGQVRAEGLPAAPFDELREGQEQRLREALARGRTVLATALAAPVPGLPA